jgi:hypothetical protein
METTLEEAEISRTDLLLLESNKRNLRNKFMFLSEDIPK